jgi:hypothetical protein
VLISQRIRGRSGANRAETIWSLSRHFHPHQDVQDKKYDQDSDHDNDGLEHFLTGRHLVTVWGNAAARPSSV